MQVVEVAVSQDHATALQPGHGGRLSQKQKKTNISKYFIFPSCCKRDCVLDLILSLVILMYTSATDLCTLILYPEALLNSFIRSRSFCDDSLGFSRYMIIPSAKTV